MNDDNDSIGMEELISEGDVFSSEDDDDHSEKDNDSKKITPIDTYKNIDLKDDNQIRLSANDDPLTASMKKDRFYKKYSDEIEATRQPMIYSVEQRENENKINSYLTYNEVEAHIKQEKNKYNDVSFFKLKYKTVDELVKMRDTGEKRYISEIISRAKSLATDKTNLNNSNITRKAYIAKNFAEEPQFEHAHTFCACIFNDKKKNKTTIIAPSLDASYEKYFRELKPENIAYKLIDLQKDKKSCGVVAIEMIKYLTTEWYEKHKDEIEKLEGDKIPDSMLPKELLAYKHGGLYEIYNDFPDVFYKLISKQYIKKTYTEDDLQKDPELKYLKVQNKHLQEKKTRFKYYNAYKHRKRKIQEEKHSPKYYEAKNKIIKELEKRFENQQPDSEFSGNEKEIQKDSKINLNNNQNQINEIKQ